MCIYIYIYIYIIYVYNYLSTTPLRPQGPRPAVVAPPSSVVKRLWEVFVWRFEVLFLLGLTRSARTEN